MLQESNKIEEKSEKTEVKEESKDTIKEKQK